MKPNEFRAWNIAERRMVLDFWKTYKQPEWTLMQFIGIYDRIGKMIFEGDIVRLTETFRRHSGEDDDDATITTWIGVIRFSAGCFWFQAPGRAENCWFHHNPENIEVIGNIFENPELIPKWRA